MKNMYLLTMLIILTGCTNNATKLPDMDATVEKLKNGDKEIIINNSDGSHDICIIQENGLEKCTNYPKECPKNCIGSNKNIFLCEIIGTRSSYCEKSYKSAEFETKDYMPNGKGKLFYPNGNIKLEGYYKNGNRDKTFQSYSEYGDLEDEWKYVNGEAISKEQEYITKKVKQYGKPFCDGMLGQYALRKMQPPKNCILKQGFPMNVLQQTTEGTIISFEYYQVDGTYLIMKNPKDASLVDGQRIEYGLFENVGTFEYVSVLGAPRTILKLRRIEYGQGNAAT